MGDEGYTLVEVLAALTIIGLSLSAMAGGVKVLGELQQRGAQNAKRVERQQAITGRLSQLLQGRGPFASAGGVALTGDANGFAFACGSAVLCEARLNPAQRTIAFRSNTGAETLGFPAGPAPHFVYLGGHGVSDHWPPDNPTDWQPLQAIALQDRKGDQPPMAIARIWVEGESHAMASQGATP